MQAELYTAAQGLLARQIELDVATHNLSNVDTQGFRRTQPFFQVFNAALEGGPLNPLNHASNNQPVLAGKFTAGEQGPIHITGEPLDMAIKGQGYFKVSTPFGVRYTRNGQFQRSPQGELVTDRGFRVLDEGNQPVLLGSQALKVGDDGTLYQGGTAVARLALVDFADRGSLIPEEDGLMTTLNPQIQELAASGRVSNGALEGSNVDLATEMIHLMEAQRAYEMNVRAIRTIDRDMNEAVINTFAR